MPALLHRVECFVPCECVVPPVLILAGAVENRLRRRSTRYDRVSDVGFGVIMTGLFFAEFYATGRI